MSIRPFGPKQPSHPSIGKQCPACDKPFEAGDYTTLISLGPGDDDEAQEKCREGKVYNAVAVEVHWKCATGKDKAGMDTMRVIDCLWFTNRDGSVGIVIAEDPKTGERGAFIGAARGEDEIRDAADIAEWGSRFPPETIKWIESRLKKE